MSRPFFFFVLAGLAAAVFMPTACPAVGDSLGAGFYTRGADAAAYIDQGNVVMDPFYLPVQTGAILPRITLTVTHEDNVFLEPDDPKVGTTIRLIPGLLAMWGRPTHNHVYADYGLTIPIYQSENELDEKPSHMLKLGAVMLTPKSQMRAEAGYRRLEDVDNTVGARVTQENFLGDANVEYRLSAKTSGGVLGRLERHLFDDDRYVDYDRYYGAGRLYYRATAKSEIFVQGGLGRDDPHENRDYASRADYFDCSIGLRGKQSPKFNASGRIGYMWRTYDSDRDDYSHWIASLRAESSPFGLTTFTGELYADIRPAMDAKAWTPWIRARPFQRRAACSLSASVATRRSLRAAWTIPGGSPTRKISGFMTGVQTTIGDFPSVWIGGPSRSFPSAWPTPTCAAMAVAAMAPKRKTQPLMNMAAGPFAPVGIIKTYFGFYPMARLC